jgi:ribosomal protein S6--L-glutamate ligase
MKLGILTRNKNLHSIRRLLKEAKSARVQPFLIDPLECSVVVGGAAPGIYLGDRPVPECDIILPRIGASVTDFGLAVVTQFEAMGVKVINGSLAIAQSRDKLRATQVLSEKGIDVPATVLLRSGRGLRSALRQVQGTPAVLKVIQGTQGVGVMIVESVNSAQSVMETLWNIGQDVLVQQYIAESAGRDIRAFVIGDKVVAAMRRQARDGEFRSNIHRGGEGVLIELKDSYKRAAINAARVLGLGIAGVDLLESLSGPKVIEVNSSPGFEGIEQATGLNIARMIIKYAQSLHRGRGPRRKTAAHRRTRSK